MPAIDYARFRDRPDFQALRRRRRRFVFPLAIAFLTWYFAFVIVAATQHELMATPVLGALNLGLVLGLLQFVTTFVITMLYVRFANRDLDPMAAGLRDELAAELAASTDAATGSGSGSGTETGEGVSR